VHVYAGIARILPGEVAFPFSFRVFEQPDVIHVERLPESIDQSAVVGVMGLQVGVHGES
jgi:hypothetical protein